MKIYLAAPLFTDAERAFNVTLTEALSAAGHDVYLPQRDTPTVDGAARTTATFRANLSAVANADAVVAVCEGPQVDDGTAWEIGYAYGRNIPVFGLRTDVRLAQQPDERINLMILESLNELSPSIPQLIHTLRYAEITRRRSPYDRWCGGMRRADSVSGRDYGARPPGGAGSEARARS